MSGTTPLVVRNAVACGTAAWVGTTYADIIRSFIPTSARDLLGLPAAVAPAVTTSAAEVQAIALQASVTAIQQLLEAQKRAASTSFWKVALLLGIPAAAVYCLGWAEFGWVSPNQLTQSLQSVTASVQQTVATLSDSLHARFGTVDAALAENTASVIAVREEVQAVGESVRVLETRLPPLEKHAERSAQGVEVLCDLIATSGLLSNASESALARLGSFTGTTDEPPAPPSRPELPEPAPAALQQAAPAFMRALMEPSSSSVLLPTS